MTRPVGLAAAAVVLGLGLAACGQAPAPLVIPTTASTAPATTTTTTPAQAVIAGWVAFSNAGNQAALQMDPGYPGLAQTEVNPALRNTELVLDVLKSAGDTARGTVGLGHPVVVSYTPTKAVVRSCIYDDVIVYEANGKPVPGILGSHGPEVVTTTMVKTAGAWMAQSGTFKVVASCPA